MMNDKIQNFIYNHKKLLAVFGIFITISIIIISTIIIVNVVTKTATIEVRFAPSSATATINGKVYKNGTYNIEPGTYTIEIKEDNFITETKTFTAKEGETTPVFALLSHTTEGSTWWQNNSDEDQIFIGSIISQLSIEENQKLLEKFPILKELPINIEYYSQDYSKYTKYSISYKLQDNNESLKLIITDYTGNNHKAALDNLRTRGYNPDDFEIQYIDSSSSQEWGKADI